LTLRALREGVSSRASCSAFTIRSPWRAALRGLPRKVTMAARWKLLLATFAVTLALANCVGAASARNISVNNSGFRIVWTPMSITARETVECDVTMEGTFHYRTFVKMRSLLIGNITRAIVRHETCRGGDFFAL